MYFVIAAMKGEPGRPTGAGWAGCSGGRGGGVQGEGWARLPGRTYCPRLAAGAPPGCFGPLQRRPLSRVTGSACLLSGQRRRGWTPPPPQLLAPLAPVSRRVLLAPGGAPGRKFAGSRRALAGRGGSEELGGSRGRPRRVPRARTPDSSGLRREGAAARPGRACARVRCHPRGLVGAPGLGPSPPLRPGSPERPVRAACPPGPLPKAPRP